MNEEFIKKIITLRGEIGKKWLKNLPQIIKDYERMWQIRVLLPFPLSYNYVALAKTADGEKCGFKNQFPPK